MVESLKWQRERFWMWRERFRERVVIALVWRLPHIVVYWAYIRVLANATSGANAVPIADAEFSVCAKAWMARRGGDRTFADA